MQHVPLSPERLLPGTRVGPWRVLERRGLGALGAVYRTVGAEGTRGPVALKLALRPRPERFAREVELLSRIHHPNVPRLVDQGAWQLPSGVCLAYVAMELVEGVSLYQWAKHWSGPRARRGPRRTFPSSRAPRHDAMPFAWSTIAVDLPPRPFPGQRRLDAKGRCPLKGQVPINGGCWIKLPVELKDCEGEGYIYEGGCYVPVFPPARPPTSSPTAPPARR